MEYLLAFRILSKVDRNLMTVLLRNSAISSSDSHERHSFLVHFGIIS